MQDHHVACIAWCRLPVIDIVVIVLPRPIAGTVARHVSIGYFRLRSLLSPLPENQKAYFKGPIKREEAGGCVRLSFCTSMGESVCLLAGE